MPHVCIPNRRPSRDPRWVGRVSVAYRAPAFPVLGNEALPRRTRRGILYMDLTREAQGGVSSPGRRVPVRTRVKTAYVESRRDRDTRRRWCADGATPSRDCRRDPRGQSGLLRARSPNGPVCVRHPGGAGLRHRRLRRVHVGQAVQVVAPGIRRKTDYPAPARHRSPRWRDQQRRAARCARRSRTAEGRRGGRGRGQGLPGMVPARLSPRQRKGRRATCRRPAPSASERCAPYRQCRRWNKTNKRQANPAALGPGRQR